MKVKEEVKGAYEAPQVRVIEVEVEQGYALSEGDIKGYRSGDGWS